MFGPTTAGRIEASYGSSHRDEAFHEALRKALAGLQRLPGASGYDLMVMTGSGTLGLEAAAASLAVPVAAPADTGKFSQRLARILDRHRALDPQAPRRAAVRFETSASRLDPGPAFLADAISSYPFHDLPRDCAVWVTVSSKLLGAAPVLAIVGVRPDAWDLLRPATADAYLSLASHHAHAQAEETPFTPAVPLVQDLAARLEALDVAALRARIRRNAQRVADAVGDGLVGERCAPALTIRRDRLPASVAAAFGLYRSAADWTVFTYSEPDEAYKLLADAISDAKPQAQEPAQAWA